jgi:hypothetical protein
VPAPSSATIDLEQAPEHIELERLDQRHPAPISHAAFVWWLLGGLLVGLLVIGLVDWYVDPTGVTGRQTRWQVADNSKVRSVKLDLYERLLRDGAPPKVVLLGSSRTMKFSPADVTQLTGDSAFNAAVSGGVPRDVWLFVQLISERQGDAFPHLVWGLDADAFRNKQLRDGLSTDPRMAKFVPRRERLGAKLAMAGTLTELQTLQATWRSVRAGGAPAAAAHGRNYSARGFQEWSLPYGRTQAFRDIAIRREVAQYAGFIFGRDGYRRVEDAPVREFTNVVRLANEHGDVPTIFLTPYHPMAERLMARDGLRARERDVRAKLLQLQHEGSLHFRIVDLSDLESFDGDPAQFYDGVHMTPANTRRALVKINAAGALAAD